MWRKQWYRRRDITPIIREILSSHGDPALVWFFGSAFCFCKLQKALSHLLELLWFYNSGVQLQSSWNFSFGALCAIGAFVVAFCHSALRILWYWVHVWVCLVLCPVLHGRFEVLYSHDGPSGLAVLIWFCWYASRVCWVMKARHVFEPLVLSSLLSYGLIWCLSIGVYLFGLLVTWLRSLSSLRRFISFIPMYSWPICAL